jgi:hypothetical protein
VFSLAVLFLFDFHDQFALPAWTRRCPPTNAAWHALIISEFGCRTRPVQTSCRPGSLQT